MEEHLLNRLRVLGELVRLSMTLNLEDMLETVAAKSTDVLGDTAFIVLESDVEVAFCTDKDRLIRMLRMGFNLSQKAVAIELLRGALEKGEAVVLPNLQRVNPAPELQLFVDKHGLLSLIATPIRGRDHILGAFISISTAPKKLTDHDVAAATELADFTAMAIEHARSATIDPVTGVYNRRFFDEVLNREAARSQRSSTALSLMMIDLDNFKDINERHGHPVGDNALVQIGHVISACVRHTDFVFRYGGDEFAILLPGTTADGALRAGEKILERARSSNMLELIGYSGTTTVSIGIAEHKRGELHQTLVNNADQALREAKRAGKNTIRIFKERQDS